MKILAVDDEPYIRELMPLLAARVGFPDVTTVSSGPLALDALAGGGKAFDCLILDINMPEMDGIELCRRVRQIEGYRKTPVIMLTAMSEREFMDSAFRAGATDYATKPFDINELGARLRVAQELMVALREAQIARESVVAAGSVSTRAHDFDLSEAIAIDGCDGLVDFVSLKNYLKQSSRAGLAASQVIAVTVDRIKDIYDRASADEFAYALREVADAVNDVMRPGGGLISYAGDGAFVVVCNCAAPIPSSEVESDVQHLLDEKNSEYDCGTPMDIEVSIGNPVQPSFGDIADVPKSVERAIARAQLRSKAKRDEPRGANIRRPGM